MNRTRTHRLLRSASLAAGVGAFASTASAVNPLEYPDNGANQFARGGAYVALATDPVAVHYNPAALATLAGGVSFDARLNWTKICFDRRGGVSDVEGPLATRTGPTDNFEFFPACNERRDFPVAIPTMAMNWRASKTVGIGIAVVPPSAYGTGNEEWQVTTPGLNENCVDTDLCEAVQDVPSPYRFMTVNGQSTILYPTLSMGWEAAKGFRVGVGFISGFAIVNTQAVGIATVRSGDDRDHAEDDSRTHLRVKDLFMPGGILSLHYSATKHLDFAAWGRWVDAVKTNGGEIDSRTLFYNSSFSDEQPLCEEDELASCPRTTAVENQFGDDAIDYFEFPIPPEVRLGVRFHLPRSGVDSVDDNGYATRDPLRDDIFDLELDGTWTANSSADTITIRFLSTDSGIGAKTVLPVGALPPNADRPTGFKDSWGVRFGGQVALVPDKVGLLAGTWIETESQHPELLSISPAGPLRGGYGGGVTLRQEIVDFTFAYQRHWSRGLDNGGFGLVRAGTGFQGDGSFTTQAELEDVETLDRRQFRSFHTVNGGRMTQSGHAIALGAVVRF